IVQRKLKVFGSLMEMDPQPAQLMSQRGGARIHAVLATTRSAEEVRDVLVGLPEVEKVEAQSAAVARTQAPPGEVGASQTGAADGERASLRVVEHVVVSESAGPPDPEVLRPEPTVRVRAEALDKLLDQAAEVLH